MAVDTDPTKTGVPSLEAPPPVLRGASTANVTLANLDAGQTLDGLTLAAGDLVLLKDQTDQKENGVYLIQADGSAPVRAPIANTTEGLHGLVVVIAQGTANADSMWQCTSDNPVIGTDNIVFARAGSADIAAHVAAADPHTQYMLLAGRSGGQTPIGGTGSGDILLLKSTSHATKGGIHLEATDFVLHRNAYTSATNYEAVTQRWDTNVWKLQSEAGSAGGTTRAMLIGPGSSVGTDIAGAPLTFVGGRGTGAGVGGSIIFQVAAAGGAGSTPNALATALTISTSTVTAALPVVVGTAEATTLTLPSNYLAVFDASDSVVLTRQTGNNHETWFGTSGNIGYLRTSTATPLHLGTQSVDMITLASDSLNIVYNLNGANERMRMSAAFSFYALSLGPSSAIAFGPTNPGTAPDSYLVRDGAVGTVSLQAGTTAQTLRIYGTTTGSAYADLKHDQTNALWYNNVAGGKFYVKGQSTAYIILDPVNMQINSSANTSLTIAGQTNGFVITKQAHATNGYSLRVTNAADTALMASTEQIDVYFDLSASKTWATGALALNRQFVVQAGTVNFAGTSTLTDGVTFAVSGPPITGTNATITRPWIAVFGTTAMEAVTGGIGQGAVALFGAGSASFTIRDSTNNAEGRLYVNGTAFYVSTTTGNPLVIQTSGSDRWNWDTSGHFLPSTNGTYNIGSASFAVNGIYAYVLTLYHHLGTQSALDFGNDGSFAQGISFGTTNGLKLGTGATQKLGFWNATPVVQPAAYTQTYSTADRTHAAQTQQTLTDNSGGTASTTLAAITGGGANCENATKNAIASLAARLAEVAADVLDLKQLANAIIDDHQAIGLCA